MLGLPERGAPAEWLSALSWPQPRLKEQGHERRGQACGPGRPAGRLGCCASCRGPVSGRVVCRAGLCGLVGGVGAAAGRPAGLGVQWSASTYPHLLGAHGPLVAAVVVTGLGRGWDGLGALSSQATAWRGRGRWLALATLGPLTLFLMAVVVARLVEGQWPALDRFGASTEYPALPIVAYWLANLVFYGFGEEVGWR